MCIYTRRAAVGTSRAVKMLLSHILGGIARRCGVGVVQSVTKSTKCLVGRFFGVVGGVGVFRRGVPPPMPGAPCVGRFFALCRAWRVLGVQLYPRRAFRAL